MLISIIIFGILEGFNPTLLGQEHQVKLSLKYLRSLQLHEHHPWILNGVFDSPEINVINNLNSCSPKRKSDLPQECDSFATVHQTVIIGESYVHHGSYDHLQRES